MASLLFHAVLVIFFNVKVTLQSTTLHADAKNVKVAHFFPKRGFTLAISPFRSLELSDEPKCLTACVKSDECYSVNIKKLENENVMCELLDHTMYHYPEKLTRSEGSTHWYSKSCKENEEISKKTKKCKEIFYSCKDVLTKYKNSTNGIYELKSIITGKYYNVYCHMTDIETCGGGGWTLVMKLDGNKNTFTYDSSLWKNKRTYAIQDGLEGMSEKESKLASYSNTPFTKICLGMSHNRNRKWMTLNYAASSLYSVIADGQFRATIAGKATWKSLIVGSSLQNNCKREGFNVNFNGNSFMRIGIVANNEQHCGSCDSWLGFSTAHVTDDNQWTNRMVCGNKAICCYLDNGSKTLVTFGYILVQ